MSGALGDPVLAAYLDIIQDCLVAPQGKRRLAFAHDVLLRDFNSGRFNADRAAEVFQMMVERAVIDHLGSAGAHMVKTTLKESGATAALGRKFSIEFIQRYKAADQRPTRRGLGRWVFGK